MSLSEIISPEFLELDNNYSDYSEDDDFIEEEIPLVLHESNMMSNIYKINEEKVASLDEAAVDYINVKILTHEEILGQSKINVKNEDDLINTLMGGNNNALCSYCNNRSKDCIGHNGSILLPFIPIPGLVDEINHILTSICIVCHRIKTNVTGLSTTQLAIESRKGCKHCGNLSKDGNAVIRYSLMDGKRETAAYKNITISYEDAFILFNKLPQEDIDVIGMTNNKPSDLIMRSYPVLPYNVRIRVEQDGKTSVKHMETLYRYIINANTILRNTLTKSVNEFLDYELQFENAEVFSYMTVINALKHKIDTQRLDTSTKLNIDTTISSIYTLHKNVITAVHNFVYGTENTGSKKGIPITGMIKIMQGKTGSHRALTMGRRVNFSARTVLTPGGELNVNEIGIPRRVAETVTSPIHVCDFNIQAVQYRLEMGEILFVNVMGNKGIMRTFTINHTNRFSFKLSIGDIAHHKLYDGVYVLNNRQPTLNKQNYIALKTRLSDNLTFSINLSTTSPQNADFDGDEANIHVPQTTAAMVEAELFSVTSNFKNDTNYTAMFGIVYNSLSGSYMITNNKNDVDTRKQYSELLEKLNGFIQLEYNGSVHDFVLAVEGKKIEPTDDMKSFVGLYRDINMIEPKIFYSILERAIYRARLDYKTTMESLKRRVLETGQLWYSAHALISLSFPEGFYYAKPKLIIKNGIVMKGTIDSSEIGRKDNNILTQLYSDFRGSIIQMMSIIQFIANSYLDKHSLSVNYFDCFSDDNKSYIEIAENTAKAQKDIDAIIGIKGIVDPEDKVMETKILDKLNYAAKIPKDFEKSFKQDSALMIMSNSGAKGDVKNLAQISCGLGVQRVQGKLIKRSLAGNRIFPSIKPHDRSLKSLGFVRSPFIKGLDPEEFLFHNMTVRESLIDTATGTQSTGQLNRNLNKSLENVIVTPDGAVTNNNNVIQFVYGTDGFDASSLTNVPLDGNFVSSFVNVEQLAHRINQTN